MRISGLLSFPQKEIQVWEITMLFVFLWFLRLNFWKIQPMFVNYAVNIRPVRKNTDKSIFPPNINNNKPLQGVALL
jgi:hypothetical protein